MGKEKQEGIPVTFAHGDTVGEVLIPRHLLDGMGKAPTEEEKKELLSKVAEAAGERGFHDLQAFMRGILGEADEN